MSSLPAESAWPQSLGPLKKVDDLLRCGICFDYFNIAMIIPQCSHNYCSLCIRKSLSYKAQCPICSMAASGPDLMNNRILDELVQNFTNARQRLFQVVLDSASVPPPALFTKRASIQSRITNSLVGFASEHEKPFTDTVLGKENICTSKSLLKTSKNKSTNIKLKQEESPYCSEGGQGTFGQVAESTSPVEGTMNPETPSTSATKFVPKVQCPVCGVAVQEMQINKHLDNCLSRDEKKESLRSGGHTKKFLPKVVYNLLSDRELKKKLKEYGLSTQGTKQQLIKRHREFVHMYNSQCDSLHPKSVAEIVKELENTEKTRVQLESSTSREDMTFTKNQTENEIDEIHSNYRKRHKAEFQLLIDQMMSKQKKHASKRNIKEEPKENEITTEELTREIGEKMSVEEEQTDWAPITDHSPKTESLDCGRSECLDLSDVEGMDSGSSFQLPGSSVRPQKATTKTQECSSSDIIRDLEIAGMYSDSLDNNSTPDKKTTKQKSRHFRSSSPVFLRQSKRRKNSSTTILCDGNF